MVLLISVEYISLLGKNLFYVLIQVVRKNNKKTRNEILKYATKNCLQINTNQLILILGVNFFNCLVTVHIHEVSWKAPQNDLLWYVTDLSLSNSIQG